MTSIQFQFPGKNFNVTINMENKPYSPSIDIMQLQNDSEQWLFQLKQYLKTVLLPLTVNKIDPQERERAIQMLLDQKYDSIWSQAFTHPTFDANKGRNYESIEQFGDLAQKLCFNDFIRKKIPDIPESLSSQYIAFFLSKEFQSALGKALKIDDWVRSKIKTSIHVKEDVEESFVGALYTIGNDFSLGTGIVLCSSFVDNVFQQVPLEESKNKTDKTIFKEIIETMSWGKLQDEGIITVREFKDESRFEVDIRLPALGVKFLRGWGVNLDGVIGHGEGNVKSVATANAYHQAVTKLAEKNIFLDNIINAKNVFDRSENSPYYPYFSQVEEKAKGLNYSKIIFSKPASKKRSTFEKYAQIIAVSPEKGKDAIMITVVVKAEPNRPNVFPLSDIEINKFALRHFLKFGYVPDVIVYSEALGKIVAS